MALYTNMALKATQGNEPYKYLGVINDDSENEGYVEYSTDTVQSKSAKFAVEYAFNEFVHIRSCLTNKYLIRVKNNVVALRSMANNQICQRADVIQSRGKKDRLVATANGLLEDTYLEVVEPVISRIVNVYEFDLDKARIHNVSLIFSQEHTWDNNSDEVQSGSANGTISTKKSHTFSNNITVSGSVTTSFVTGIPCIAKGEIEVSASASRSREWGQTEEEGEEVGDTFTVVIKPMKRTIARGVATKGTCDVPFAYVQKDFPTNGGPPIVTKLYDGVFTGANAYSFYGDVRYEELPSDKVSSDRSITKVN